MATQKGRDVLLKIEETPGQFVTIAGLRAKTIALNASSVDATSADSPDAWRELMAGAGVKSCKVSGAGVFKDAPSDALLREAFFAQTAKIFRLVLPDFGAIEGPFLVESLDYGGDHESEAVFAVALASAGALSFTP